MSAQDSSEEPTKGKVQVGDTAPNFTLSSATGEQVSLSDFRDKKHVVLYFYPKDHTGGCTAQACSFRDSYEVFRDAGAEVIGVSSDTVESHESFAKQNRLPFILLSDNSKALRKRYGVPKLLGIIDGRVTYVIDKGGVVRHIFSSGAPGPHLNEALTTLKSLGE